MNPPWPEQTPCMKLTGITVASKAYLQQPNGVSGTLRKESGLSWTAGGPKERWVTGHLAHTKKAKPFLALPLICVN
jgi:hypothetical protein